MTIEIQAADRKKYWNAVYEASPTHSGLPGLYTVAKDVAEAMKTYSAMRRVSTVLTTTAGLNMGYVNSDGREELGEQLDQNQPISNIGGSDDFSFGLTPITLYKYSSKLIRVPMELWQDAAIDFPKFMASRVAARIGRITNRKFTVGVGSPDVTSPNHGIEPIGIVPNAPVGKIGFTGQFMTLIYDDLEDLVFSVDEVYRQSPQCVWMMHEQTLRFIKKMKDSQGRPLNLVTRGADLQERLLDYPVVINNDMPIMAANAKSILFGDFSTYVIRDVLDIDIRRMMDSEFVLKGQLGFLGFARAGGAYVDVGGAIKAYQNSAT